MVSLIAGFFAAAQAQTTTNSWILNANGIWSLTNNWSPNTNYPNSAGAVAFVTNNVSGDRIVYLDTNATVGRLIWGDFDRGSQIDLRTTNATPSVLTFDTGDERQALFEHGTSDRPGRDIGNGNDDTDAGILVTDPNGLFIDNWQQFLFHTAPQTNAARAFNGGGNNVTKGEDGNLIFYGIVTNIATFAQRDGFVEFRPDGNPLRRPGISNLVLGVAPGVIDTGANPDGAITNTGEGGAYDRIQFPYFSILGVNSTNGMDSPTNAMNITFNRGVFRSLTRGVSNTFADPPAVYSGTVTLNGSGNENFFIIEHQANAGLGSHMTTVVRQTIFNGQFTGSGGLTKIGTGEMTFTTNNNFTGAVNINRAFDSGRGRFGGVGLRENGTFDGVSSITLSRDGSLFTDNSAINLSNRINDAASLTARGRSQFEMLGNAAAASYERIGAVTGAQGSFAIEFDKIDATPQGQTLELASLYRAPGSVIGFHASDLQQGVFGSTGPSNIVINLLDVGASLAQVGAGGGAGTTARNVALGVFGGDGVDYSTNNILGWMVQVPNRADEFMTVDAGRLRTLDPVTEMVNLGGRVTNALLISQASAAAGDNVNINFASAQIELGVGALSNGFNLVVNKRVVGDATFNAIRFGVVRGTNALVPNGLPNDQGRSMLIADGTRLTSESGMLLSGRDTGSTNGDLTPNGNVLVYGGTLDLDGTANNREAIVHNASGANIYLRTSVDAANGLTKSGTENVLLESANNLGGVVNIAQGNLYVRDNNALRGATEVNVQGDGALIMYSGITITNVTLRAGERPYGSPIIVSESSHNVFGGDIMIENVDPQGMLVHDVRLRASVNNQTATLTLLGDIGLSESGASSDVTLNDPVQLGFLESGGILNLKGVVGDRLVDGQALTFDPRVATNQTRITGGYMANRGANENYVMRFNIDGNGGGNYGDELNVNIYNPWNAAGRIYAQQGTIRFLGDPAAGGGNFWTTNVLAVSDFNHGFSGFQFGGGGTDAGGAVTLLLTKNGQSFNAERWTVDNSISGNTMTMGLENNGASNATVTIGNEFYDSDPAAADDQITISGGAATTVRELRLFAHDGFDSATTNETTGRVNVIQSIRGNDFSMLTVLGNGTVALQATTNGAIDQSNDIRLFNLLGGELILDRQSAGLATDVRRTSDARSALFLSGGDVTLLGGGGTAEAFGSNLTVRAGDSRVAVVGAAFGSTDLYLATNAVAAVTRQRGGTVQFIVDHTGFGVENITLGGVAAGSRIGSWATYGTNYGQGALTWAATDAGGVVGAFSAFATDGYGAGLHSDATIGQVFASDTNTASLRFSNGVGLDLGGFQFDVTNGGILIAPTVTAAAAITNGTLTSSGGELIIHNHHGTGGSLEISAGITGNVDLTFSGTGNTLLSGNNTFAGITRINGGTVTIDGVGRLGSVATNLEMRGGTLATTANMYFTNRTIVLGGDGGYFRVAASTTNTLGTVLSESNFLGSTRLNNGHGDLIKTGAGTLQLGINAGSTNELVAGYNMYQGLTDVREGTLRLVATNNFGLGSSHSFYDGTIVRSGATLTLGSNSLSTVYSLPEWMIFEQGASLRVENTIPGNGYQSVNLNGVMDFRGDTTVYAQGGDLHFNSSGAGYLMGSGAIIKDGDAALDIDEYSPDYTGNLVVKEGVIRLYGIRQNPLPNAGSITIGLNDNVDRGTAGFYVWPERDGYAGVFDVNQNIIVQGRNSDTRLGSYNYQHNDVVNYNGNIDLSNFATNAGSTLEFRLYVEDPVESRAVNGADEFREELFLNFNGNITGGDKRIRTVLQQNYYSSGAYTNFVSMERVEGAQVTNEMNMMVFFTLAGTNTGWTGSLEVGNRSGNTLSTDGADRDKQHFVRFGRNDGAATLAIGPSNAVVLRHDATLQAHGSTVSVGNLYSDGTQGGADGYFGNDLVTNAFLENGGTFAGTFVINQTVTNRTFQGVVRDGTYYAPNMTNLASAPLNIVKRGSGILSFDRSNYYTGTTAIDEGILRVNGMHSGGGLYSVNAGGTLGGTGWISAPVNVLDGGILAPGNGPGTLTIDGNVTFEDNAILSFEFNHSMTNLGAVPGNAFNDLVVNVNNLTLDGILNVTWSSLDVTNATDGAFWTLFTYDGALTNYGLDLSSLPAFANPAQFWFIDTTTAANEVRLAVLVPEPETWVLMILGLGLFGWICRRRQ